MNSYRRGASKHQYYHHDHIYLATTTSYNIYCSAAVAASLQPPFLLLPRQYALLRSYFMQPPSLERVHGQYSWWCRRHTTILLLRSRLLRGGQIRESLFDLVLASKLVHGTSSSSSLYFSLAFATEEGKLAHHTEPVTLMVDFTGGFIPSLSSEAVVSLRGSWGCCC